jgi:hypothetical protein
MKRQIRSQKITFENDEPGQPPPSPCVTEALAKMIESAVFMADVTININSTTGGRHSTTSFHKFARAVDINRLNNKRIDDPDNLADVLNFQQVIARHPMVAECFGPYINIRKYGAEKRQKPGMKNKHLNHLHISSQA